VQIADFAVGVGVFAHVIVTDDIDYSDWPLASGLFAQGDT
jgi:hypothetical protein